MAGQWHESEVYISLSCLFFRGRWGYLVSNTAWSFQHSSNFRIRSSLHDGTWLISITTWQAYLHHGCQLFGMTHCILKKKNRLLICPQNSVNHSFSLVEWNFMAESKSNAWPLRRKSMSSSYLCELRIWNCSFSLPCAISGTNIGIFYGLLSGLLMLLMPCLCGLLLLQLLRLLHSSVVLLMRILQ